MKIKTLDGREVKWMYHTRSRNAAKQSTLHIEAVKMIRRIFYANPVYEEAPVEITRHKKLYLDIIVPSMRLAFEVNGMQHFQKTSHFHKHYFDFAISRENDRLKAEWCELNNILLTQLNYNEDKDTWNNKIQEAIQKATELKT
jgi:hypothetical protein